MKKYYLICLWWGAFVSAIQADYIGTSGNIKFNTQDDNQEEMYLDGIGLGIGTSAPSANLHVDGDAITTGSFSVGPTQQKNATLSVDGTFAMSVETVSDNTRVTGNSMILADTTSGNLTITLPNARNVPGRIVHIKKTTALNELHIEGGGLLEDYETVTLTNGTFIHPQIKLVSSGTWNILSLSENSVLSPTLGGDDSKGWLSFDEMYGNFAHNYVGTDKATFVGNTIPDASISGQAGRAFYFDGVDDYVELSDDDKYDFSDNLTIAFFVKPESNGVSVSSTFNQKSYTNVNTYDEDPGEVGMVAVGDEQFLLSFQHNNGGERVRYSKTDLGFDSNGWSNPNQPAGVGAAEASSISVDSDGEKLYFSTYVHNGGTERFYIASANLDFTTLTWEEMDVPTNIAQGNNPGFGDMVIVDDRIHYAIYSHRNATEYFSLGSSNLDGSGNVIWNRATTDPNGVGNDYDSTSVAMDSDGSTLYYALTHKNEGDHELFLAQATVSDIVTNADSVISLTAPTSANTNEYVNHIGMCMVGQTLHYGYLESTADNVLLYTATSNLDGSNLSSWTGQEIYTGNIGRLGSASIDMFATSTNLNYLIQSGNTSTSEVLTISQDLNSEPIVSKEGAYALYYVQGGLILEWQGSYIKFGNLPVDQYSHVALTHDGSVLKLYIDGVEVRRQTTAQVFAQSNNDIRIGGDGTRFFHGSIDEVRLMSTALNASEILELSQE